MPIIQNIVAREIFDSRGNPTVEVDLYLDDRSWGRASVPSGASTGEHEAIELRDNDPHRLNGMGVKQACLNVKDKIAPAITNQVARQSDIDQTLCDLDGSPNKANLGANSILAVSLALAKALSSSQNIPLYQYFRTLSATTRSTDTWILPVPLMNLLNGGRHADQSTDFQEFIIMPIGATSFRNAMEMGATIFMELKHLLTTSGFSTHVGDEGGFAPQLESNQAALDLICQAVTKAGLRLEEDIVLGIDAAASEFYENGHYSLKLDKKTLDANQLTALYADLAKRYPIKSLEDGLEEDAWVDYQRLNHQLGSDLQIVGDDLFVSNVRRLEKGIHQQAANAILIKPNQIGTVSETIAAVDLARQHNWGVIISHRSGETEDTTIADLALGLGTGQIKSGSLSRTDRLAKYNRLLRLEEELGASARYAGKALSSFY